MTLRRQRRSRVPLRGSGTGAQPLRPAHCRRHGREDRGDVAARLQAKDRPPVVEQVELYVASAPHLLLDAVFFRPRLGGVAPDDLRIDLEEGLAHMAGEGEVLVRVSGPMVVVEDAADAARLVAVLEEEVLVAPLLVLLVGAFRRMGLTGFFHGLVESDGVRITLSPPTVEHGCEIRSATEPGLRSHHETGVHVHRWNIRVPWVRDERDAAGPEARILLGARDLAAEFWREFSMHRRDMHAHLLEHAAAHHGHDASAAGSADMILALPGRPLEPTGLGSLRGEGSRHLILQGLERGADPVAQQCEP